MSTRLQRSRYRLALASAALFVFLPALHAAKKEPVIVHEWGTFTALQDEKGQAIGGVNVDDEPVPGFVCSGGGPEVVPEHFAEAQNFGLPPYNPFCKGWWIGDPSVTMRLETPVIYIYPPKGQSPKSVPPLDVHVDFHGGVLSQFYPEADFSSTGNAAEFSVNEATSSSLTWKGVQLGSALDPVKSDDKVWTTPRETSAPVLELATHTYDQKGNKVPNVTAEHFLFYRGVGHLDAPLRSTDQGNTIGTNADRDGKPGELWKVEIRPDGRCAFQARRESAGLDGMYRQTKFSEGPFSEADFSAANLDSLKASMRAELVRQGLYPDEASAMLRTWDLSYFKSPGLRIFYTVPSEWVERVLPLKVTGAPVKVTRVMVGRLELVSPTQQAALTRLAAGPCPNLQPVKEAAAKALAAGKYSQAEKDAFYSGDRPLRELGIAIPPLVQDYLDLGRFRDALIIHEQAKSPSAALAEFISKNRIGPPAIATAGSSWMGVADAH